MDTKSVYGATPEGTRPTANDSLKRAWWQLPSGRIALGFVIWSTLWIVLSDFVLHTLAGDSVRKIWQIEISKEAIYVVATGILLYFFIRAREREYFAARRTSENRLRRLSESNLISICYWRSNGDITDANDAFLKLLGYTRHELMERKLNWKGLIPTEQLLNMEGIPQAVMDAGHINVEREFVRKDGIRVPVLVGAALLDSSRTRGIAYVLDMTELKTAEERSQELEHQLRQSQKLEAVGQLASGIAHDFNNLLNVIIGYACLIEAKSGPRDPTSQHATHILKAAEKASALVRKLLAFGRKQLLNPERLDINSVLQEYDTLLPRLLGDAIQFKLDLAPSLWNVEVDRIQLEQVIINLAVNARDAMPNGGTLTISTGNDLSTTRVWLAVSDTGIGMSEQTQTHIFEPFFTTKGQGTGLGLSTVYGIVTQSGGHISVSSELQRGTTFTISLPRASESTEGVRAMQDNLRPIRKSPATSRSHETILLVEDEPDLRELLTDLLRINGYEVLAAHHGKEAVVLAKDHNGPIDLLLTDIVMPHMNGIEAAAVIRRLRPAVHVIYMTGYADNSLLKSRPAGEDALLEKPVYPPLLFEKIREVLDVRQERRPA